MPTDPIRAALERLISAYDEHGGRWPQYDEDALHDAVERARADLAAEPLDPAGGGEALLAAAAAPLEGEVGELGRLTRLLQLGSSVAGARLDSEQCRFAATLLQQQAAELAALRAGIELAAVAVEPSDDELEEVWDLGHLPTDEELANDDGEQDLQFLHTSAYYRWLEEHPSAKDEDQRKRIRAVFNAGRHWGKQQAPQGGEVEE